jgi:uncharacterized protein YkwD
MKWFSNTIVALTLIATASAFFLTFSRMNPTLLTFYNSEKTQTASIIDAIAPDTPTHARTLDTGNEPSTKTYTTPKQNPVVIPDKSLTENPSPDNTNGVEVTYEYSLKRVADTLHSRSNIARSQNNLPPLVYDDTLAAIAHERSIDMVTHDYFSHTTPDGCDLSCRLKKADYPSLTMGENLAEFSDYTALSEGSLAQTFVDDWIDSATHRQNLLSKVFTREGVGVAIKNNRIVVTVIFAAPE